MKKAITCRKLKKASLMIVPETEFKVKTLRLPVWVMKAAAISCAGLIIFAAVTANNVVSLRAMQRNNIQNISRLMDQNNLQREQIQKLKQNTLVLKDSIDENMSLLAEIKKAVGIKTNSDGFNNALSNTEVAFTKIIDDGTISAQDMSNELDTINKSLTVLSNMTSVQKEEIKKSMAPINARLAYLRAIPSGRPINDVVTCAFGYRKNPFTHRGSEFHKGVDLGAQYGINVHATGDGEVIFAGWNGGYGNLVIISHGYGYQTLYAHNSKLLVKTGDKIKRGQAISKVGSTGRSTAPHVHYEIKVNGKNVNPTKYF